MAHNASIKPPLQHCAPAAHPPQPLPSCFHTHAQGHSKGKNQTDTLITVFLSSRWERGVRVASSPSLGYIIKGTEKVCWHSQQLDSSRQQRSDVTVKTSFFTPPLIPLRTVSTWTSEGNIRSNSIARLRGPPEDVEMQINERHERKCCQEMPLQWMQIHFSLISQTWPLSHSFNERVLVWEEERRFKAHIYLLVNGFDWGKYYF